jgi:hypothetical protein
VITLVKRWKDTIRARWARLAAEKRSDPTWAATSNNAWWVAYFQAQHDVEINCTVGLISRQNS